MVIRVSSTRTRISQNGAMGVYGAGQRLAEYDKWRMSWNGNLFAPPPSGAVLYLPGHPGQGSTITDFSNNFLDSGIDTDDELTLGETHITCDADATTAIPIGSVISIQNEKYLVTATGLTLTVIPAYDGTHSATHATNADIYRRTSNHGTIYGAVWKRLPSGLWVLSFDGDDYVQVNGTTTFDLLNNFTYHVWVNPTNNAVRQTLIGRNNVAGVIQLEIGVLEGRFSAIKAGVYIASGAGVTSNQPQLLSYTKNGTGAGCNALYRNGEPKVLIDDVNEDNSGAALIELGRREPASQSLTGQLALPQIILATQTPSQVANKFNQERHLFGV